MSFFSRSPLAKITPASLFSSQARIGKHGFLLLDSASAALTAADLLNAVAVKLPPFWPDNIETWFMQSESQFRLKGVTASQV